MSTFRKSARISIMAFLAAVLLFGVMTTIVPSEQHVVHAQTQAAQITTITNSARVPNGWCQVRLRPVFDPWTNLGPFHHFYLAASFSVNGPYGIWDLTNFGQYNWANWGSNYPQPNVTRFGVSENWLLQNWPTHWNMFWNDYWDLVYSC